LVILALCGLALTLASQQNRIFRWFFCERFEDNLGSHLQLSFSERLDVCTTIGTDSLFTIFASDSAGRITPVLTYETEMGGLTDVKEKSSNDILLVLHGVEGLKTLNPTVNGVKIDVDLKGLDFPKDLDSAKGLRH